MGDNGKKTISILVKTLLGFVFLILGVLAVKTWWFELAVLVKGSLGPFLILLGAVTLAIAKE